MRSVRRVGKFRISHEILKKKSNFDKNFKILPRFQILTIVGKIPKNRQKIELIFFLKIEVSREILHKKFLFHQKIKNLKIRRKFSGEIFRKSSNYGVKNIKNIHEISRFSKKKNQLQTFEITFVENSRKSKI